MKANGVHVFLEKSKRLSDFLETQNYDITKIAVERNGQIVQRGTYQDIMLEDDDSLEIVRFVGGG